MIMNDESGRMYTEVIMAYFKALCILLEGLMKQRSSVQIQTKLHLNSVTVLTCSVNYISLITFSSATCLNLPTVTWSPLLVTSL